MISRRLVLPVAVVVAAVALGLLLFAPTSVARPSALRLRGAVLADATSPNAAATLAEGKTLFDQSCASCHGADANGSALAPSLAGLGSGTVDLWVSSGWMPLANPAIQPAKKPAKFNRAQTIAIAKYVASLSGNTGFAIPSVNLKGTNVANGMSVFAQNCAPCHTITGSGDALSNGISAPSLHDVTKTMIMEAVRTGPGNMPRFGPGSLSTKQVLDVVAYVTRYIQHPTNPGGLGLGGIGPVAEGFIGLFIGVGLCVLAAFWIGERNPRGAAGGEHGPMPISGGGAGGASSEREEEHV